MFKKLFSEIVEASGMANRPSRNDALLEAPIEDSSNLAEYLSYYCRLDKPNFAVLVTGDWGAGKTHQVKKLIPEDQRIYISLFGVQTVEQLHSEVFAAQFPLLGTAQKHLDKGAKDMASGGGLWAIAGSAPSAFNALFKRQLVPDKTLIFDDLERSNLKLKEVIGAINNYVEHIGFRTIVIAHDSKLSEKFLQVKEKTFGQTIHINPQTEEAFAHFLGNIGNSSALDFIKNFQTEILETFHQSEAKSLRILRHVIEDIVRLFSVIAPEHITHRPAMAELLQTFVAFDIEIRSGALVAEDLKNRSGLRLGHSMRSRREGGQSLVAPRLLVADDKYPSIDLEHGMFDDDLLIEMFIEGSYPPKSLFRAIANSSYFVDPAEMEPWKVVIHFDDLDDSIVNEAYLRMEKKLADFEIVESGEFLHVCALRMVMALKARPARNISEVVAESKQYIDKLLQMGKLPPRETEWRWYERFQGSYDGFSYWILEDYKSEFNEIYTHLVDSRVKAFNEKAPQIAKELMDLMKAEPQKFFEAVSPTHTGNNPYAHIALFFDVSPESFVSAWLDLPKSQWRTVSSALENRYRGASLFNDLSSEKDWALGVLKQLDLAAEATSGFSAFRINRIRPKVLIDLAQAGLDGPPPTP